jgi:2-polyprenyl-3-methyl-5-hydroxy-6-metoxy-1,4-benzoquinol methylase
MALASYHDAIWEAVPEGLEPQFAALRRAFLLEEVDAVARSLGRPPRVLDVGCGEGYFAHCLVRAGAEVIAADVSQEALRRARARERELELALITDSGAWPLADASFDVVWAGETIEHVLDTAGWVSEVRRVLRSGGTLLVSTPAHGRALMLALALSGKRFDRHFEPRGDHLRFYSTRSLRALLDDFGFEQVRARGAAGVPGARRLLLASARRGRY